MFTKEYKTRYCLVSRGKNMDKPIGLKYHEILVKFTGKPFRTFQDSLCDIVCFNIIKVNDYYIRIGIKI